MHASRRVKTIAVGGGLTLLGAAAVFVLFSGPEPSGDPPRPAAPEEHFLAIPKIDVHTHIGPDDVDEMLAIMDENGVAVALNASGGHPGPSLDASIAAMERTRGRIRPFCNFDFSKVEDAGFATYARTTLETCKARGGVGLKIFKSLGLGTTLADGSLLAVDDPRLDVVFETAGALGLPVLIHSGDPQAFFRPPTRDNERYAELRVHPSWSFHGERPDGGGPWPSWEDVFAQYERRVARHPSTTFIGAHFGNAPEDPARVGAMLDRYPNLHVETGARVPEIGRHDPGELRALFERHRDRILFGTDLALMDGALTLGSRGESPDRRDQVPAFFAAHFRYFETRTPRMAHPTPIQGDWTIDGLGLSREVLERLYQRNASELFGIDVP
jgi:hypothetical protein